LKAHHHLIFFVLILLGSFVLFFSSELLLPESIKRLIFRSPAIDTIAHFIGFFILTWLMVSIIKCSMMSTLLTLSLYAAFTELGQYYLGFRNAELSDVFADIGGVTFYLFLRYTFLKYKIFTLKRIIKVKQPAESN
jgi:hypothetical protein